MDVFNTISLLRCFFITCVSFGMHMFCCISPNFAIAQIVLEDQTYQSNVTVGDWNDPISWQVWQSGTWQAATVPPNRNNDVFIRQGQEIRLTQNHEVRNLYLYSALNPGQKLNLQTFDLDVYGALHAFEAPGGVFILSNSANPSMNWIYPVTGSIVFKGQTRVVVDRNSWSGQTNYSSYIVRFNPDPGEVLTVNAGIKASQFIIETGTVYQTLNQNGTPASSTFSFNIHDDFGLLDYGSLIIRSGSRLISEATEEFGQIIRRTGMRPATEFILEEGAVLELRGDEPIIDAAFVILDGEVRYFSDRPTQQFLAHSLPTSQPIITYHHLHMLGSAIRPMPQLVEVTGNFFVFGGALQNNATKLYLIGSDDQVVDVAHLPVSHLEINKPGGLLTFNQPLQLMGDFTMREGMVNFNHQSLQINSTPTATYTYIDGSWANLAGLTLVHLPTDWTVSNASFPFFDLFAGKNRTLRLLGSLSDQAGSLTIAYIELPGVEYNAGLTDSDEHTIYYHLNSHFQMSTSNLSEEHLEIQILANDMVLEDIADLRISGYGEIAPGSHVNASWEDSYLWGNRSASLAALNGRTLTLASSGLLSVLPLTWDSFDAKFVYDQILVSWKARADVGTRFIVYRSLGSDMVFSPIGTVESINNSDEFHTYKFSDILPIGQESQWIYYQIRSKINGGILDASPVFRVQNYKSSDFTARIFPNPYHAGKLTLQLSAKTWKEEVEIQVIDKKGSVCLKIAPISGINMHHLEDKLKDLPPGLYIIRLRHLQGAHQIKWIKK